jgi:hypothetical protein
MARSVRSNPDLLGAAVAGAAAVVLLAACGGGSSGNGSAATQEAAGDGQEETAAGDGTADFCDQAAGIDERVDAALSDVDGDPSLSDAFRQIAVDLRTIEAPAEIASDWTALATGLDRMADAFGEVDLTDLDSLDALDQAEGDLTTASDDVDRYLRDECGI